MPMKPRNVQPWTAGQGVMRHGRRIKAGFVKHRKTPRHNSYRILAAKRSGSESVACPPGLCDLRPAPWPL
ncbi:hypothetical protein DW951_05935 [Agathobacter rectalis]|uniref:Uncharacterized protein n=1 Tax=Agathobacter rectalis TaxID=39491 RepID=A0A396FRL1_9FIRM|nr:hypothetical protein DXA03_10315 [Agathobacter rectalis]HCI94634.1 hypothetical protein [Eubacterium sp.]RGZ74477.1 hypothetical protein DW975_10950 [Agathobacter rectalis]RHA04812.1 hypothetical protein DW951_05935 [Agathobacter rectalis]RHA15294.1 hypothetical protein DW948_04625 [Agathobacter rectalis]